MFECANMHHLIFHVDEDAETMWLELIVNFQVLTPVHISIKLARRDLFILDHLSLRNEFILSKSTHIKLEWFVFENTLLHVFIDKSDIFLYFLQSSGNILKTLLILELQLSAIVLPRVANLWDYTPLYRVFRVIWLFIFIHHCHLDANLILLNDYRLWRRRFIRFDVYDVSRSCWSSNIPDSHWLRIKVFLNFSAEFRLFQVLIVHTLCSFMSDNFCLQASKLFDLSE